MGKDDQVDGAAIAAKILNSMPQINRDKILRKMEQSSAVSTARVQAVLVELPNQGAAPPLDKKPNPEVTQLARRIAAVINKMLQNDEPSASESTELVNSKTGSVKKSVDELYGEATKLFIKRK